MSQLSVPELKSIACMSTRRDAVWMCAAVEGEGVIVAVAEEVGVPVWVAEELDVMVLVAEGEAPTDRDDVAVAVLVNDEESVVVDDGVGVDVGVGVGLGKYDVKSAW